MPAIKKEQDYVRGQNKGIVAKVAKEHANDPYVLKKADQAKAFLLKNGFPAQLKK